MSRILLRRLAVTGPGKPEATLDFEPGLNVLTGLSNTGKSHVVECIDFALGSGTPPREIPEANGYARVQLEIEHDDIAYTIIRAYSNPEDVVWFEGPMSEWDGASGDAIKAKTNPTNPGVTLSGLLVRFSGLDPATPVAKNNRGHSQTLSFRGIAPLVIVEEPEVIKDTSPILPAVTTQHTAARSIFKLLLTGEAPNEELGELKATHDAREEAVQRVKVFAAIIEQLRDEIAERPTPRPELEAELQAIDQELASVSEIVASSGEAAKALMQQRNDFLGQAQRQTQRARAAADLQSRFGLLREHYRADVRRLEFVMEGGHFFQQIAASHCPRCGAAMETDTECHPESDDFAAIERSCRAEIEKLRPKLLHLEKAVTEASRDEEEARQVAAKAADSASNTDAEIKRVANPTAAKARGRVEEITKRRRVVEEDLLRYRELDRYLRAQQEAEIVAQQQLGRYRPVQDSAALRSFAGHVNDLLVSWRFPVQEGVHFSADNEDIQIDGKDRRDNGKGVRAVTHAAFTIGLMHQCLEAQTPHPGFVLIDTPLTHFKGVQDDIEDPALTRDLHTAFFHTLAATNVAGQTIIIENVDPPIVSNGAMHVERFSGLPGQGRQGFYPVNS